jgi:hypothetical protein
MAQNTHAETSRTLKMSDYLAEYEDTVPRWKARRVAIALGHSDKIETKILLER